MISLFALTLLAAPAQGSNSVIERDFGALHQRIGGVERRVTGNERRERQRRQSTTADSPTLGKDGARHTVTVYCDPGTPACSYYQPQLKKLMKDRALKGKVRVVYKLIPSERDQKAMRSARLALAAREKGGDKAFFKALDYLAKKDEHDEKTLKKIAKRLRLKRELKRRVLEGYTPYDGVFLRERDDAKRDGVTASPAFFVDGEELKRLTVDEIKDAIGG